MLALQTPSMLRKTHREEHTLRFDRKTGLIVDVDVSRPRFSTSANNRGACSIVSGQHYEATRDIWRFKDYLEWKDIRNLVKNTSIPGDMLMQVHALFRKHANRDGSISRRKFFKMVSTSNLFSDVFVGVNDRMAGKLFDELDQDESESIEFEELIGGLATLINGTIQEKLSGLFKLYDLDGNGLVSRDEMKVMLSVLHSSTQMSKALTQTSEDAAEDKSGDILDIVSDDLSEQSEEQVEETFNNLVSLVFSDDWLGYDEIHNDYLSERCVGIADVYSKLFHLVSSFQIFNIVHKEEEVDAHALRQQEMLESKAAEAAYKLVQLHFSLGTSHSHMTGDKCTCGENYWDELGKELVTLDKDHMWPGCHHLTPTHSTAMKKFYCSKRTTKEVQNLKEKGLDTFVDHPDVMKYRLYTPEPTSIYDQFNDPTRICMLSAPAREHLHSPLKVHPNGKPGSKLSPLLESVTMPPRSAQSTPLKHTVTEGEGTPREPLGAANLLQRSYSLLAPTASPGTAPTLLQSDNVVDNCITSPTPMEKLALGFMQSEDHLQDVSDIHTPVGAPGDTRSRNNTAQSDNIGGRNAERPVSDTLTPTGMHTPIGVHTPSPGNMSPQSCQSEEAEQPSLIRLNSSAQTAKQSVRPLSVLGTDSTTNIRGMLGRLSGGGIDAGSDGEGSPGRRQSVLQRLQSAVHKVEEQVKIDKSRRMSIADVVAMAKGQASERDKANVEEAIQKVHEEFLAEARRKSVSSPFKMKSGRQSPAARVRDTVNGRKSKLQAILAMGGQ
eukprot:GFYU01003121.1.p1 GENE.GFYU01003121.1~~GFYU01003121.1.p1  ORF type:complete len:778 (-),score=161.23 GFYU01003121.1:42-2375(-)